MNFVRVAFSTLLLAIGLFAQTASLSGVVKDSTGAVMPSVEDGDATQLDLSHRNQYGAAAGVPVPLPGYNARNRTFWFFNFEQQKEQLGAVTTIFAPTAAQREGDLIAAPGTGLLWTRMSV
jgi:hypothetical protein